MLQCVHIGIGIHTAILLVQGDKFIAKKRKKSEVQFEKFRNQQVSKMSHIRIDTLPVDSFHSATIECC